MHTWGRDVKHRSSRLHAASLGRTVRGGKVESSLWTPMASGVVQGGGTRSGP